MVRILQILQLSQVSFFADKGSQRGRLKRDGLGKQAIQTVQPQTSLAILLTATLFFKCLCVKFYCEAGRW
ncbi:hypothetical protein [Tabrizicola soli]|nr:hypothetical protein [Tabrizicola soli]